MNLHPVLESTNCPYKYCKLQTFWKKWAFYYYYYLLHNGFDNKNDSAEEILTA